MFARAVIATALLLTLHTSARAQSSDVADAGVAADAVDAGVADAIDAADAGVAAPTPEELEAIQRALASDTDERGVKPLDAAGVPDLSKVNVGAAAAPASQQPASQQSQAALDIAFVMDLAAAWFSVERPLQTGGHDPARTGVTLQQLEMSVGASVDPFMRFDSNIVLSLFGIEIEEAYATTLALPWNLQARAGQFLTRFGRINATHPHQWRFVDQPVVVGKFFGSEGSRGLGGELSWLTPLPWYAEALVSVTNADGECCARSFFGADDIGIRSPLDLLVTAAAKQFFTVTDDLSLMLGASAQTGPNASGNLNRTEVYGVDVVVRYRPVDADSRWSLSWETEALLRGRQVPFDALWDAGGYTQLVWQMNPAWETGARYELVTGVPADPLDPAWSSTRHRGALQLTFYPSHFSRLRAQTSLDYLDAPVVAAMLTLEVVVGAHGAHSY